MSKRKKIIYVAPYYPPYGAGGAERTTQLHARALIEIGYDVSIVTPKFGSEFIQEINGINIVNFNSGINLKIGEQISSRYFYNPFTQNNIVRVILNNFESKDIYCIHAQHPLIIQGASIAARKMKVPFIAHIRDTGLICSIGAPCLMEKDNYSPPNKCSTFKHIDCYINRWAGPFEKRLSKVSKSYGLLRSSVPYLIYLNRKKNISSANKIVFASNGLLNLYSSLNFFSDRKKLKVVYAIAEKVNRKNFFHEKIEKIKELKNKKIPLILYVGKVTKGKGADVLFKAHDILLKDIPDAMLIVCGNLTEDKWIINKQNCIIMGYVNQEIISELYGLCDLVVLPSTWPEPLGWSTIDAGRHFKPIVATNVGGIPEAVEHGKTGLLVEKLDSFALANAILKLIKNPVIAKKMGKLANDHIFNKFGKKSVINQLRELYNGLH